MSVYTYYILSLPDQRCVTHWFVALTVPLFYASTKPMSQSLEHPHVAFLGNWELFLSFCYSPQRCAKDVAIC